MNLKSFYVTLAFFSLLAIGCGSNKQPGDESNSGSNLMKEAENTKEVGIGKFKDIKLTHPLDEGMIVDGKSVFDSKCFSCHKLTDEKLVGPGWKGVTDRRTPEWIMNFITNTDVMLDSDLTAQKMFVTCLVRMPSQGLQGDQARHILEFMRKNDGKN